jgi:hypothetical protein
MALSRIAIALQSVASIAFLAAGGHRLLPTARHTSWSRDASFRLVVRFARRNTLFYDEDITALPRLVSAVYVGMKAMEISRYGQHDARSRLVRFSTELLKLNFQTRPKIWREQSCFYNELSALSPGWGGRDRTSEWRNQNPLPYRLATPQQAEPERARTISPARTGSDNARSIEGVRPFQQAGIPNFVRNQLPGSVTLYNGAAYAKVPGRFHAPGAAQYRPSEC